jgi:hypothetical protein
MQRIDHITVTVRIRKFWLLLGGLAHIFSKWAMNRGCQVVPR